MDPKWYMPVEVQSDQFATKLTQNAKNFIPTPMLLRSTRNASPLVNFPEAVSRGLAQDGGLYVPNVYPKFPLSFWQHLRGMSTHEIAYALFKELLITDFDHAILKSVTKDAFSFEDRIIPLVDRAAVMELFYGPTLAFKDYGARFMARILPYCERPDNDRPITVLTATSGDTGAAVADGFYGVDGVRAIILYPKGKVSPLQERQIATLGGNITAIAVDGTFDDCQRLVKEAFTDRELVETANLTSANSINIARLLPQMIYYIHAWTLLPMGITAKGLTFIVPSGNFGNLTAGLMAAKMGLPGVHFMVATNANDVVPQFLHGNDYQPRPSVSTVSNAMDVGNPSNFERLRSLFDDNDATIRESLPGFSVSDATTREVIGKVWAKHRYLIDPHTATGLEVWNNHMSKGANQGRYGVILGTAHPAKFPEVIDQVVPGVLKLPVELENILEKPVLSKEMGVDMGALKREILG